MTDTKNPLLATLALPLLLSPFPIAQPAMAHGDAPPVNQASRKKLPPRLNDPLNNRNYFADVTPHILRNEDGSPALYNYWKPGEKRELHYTVVSGVPDFLMEKKGQPISPLAAHFKKRMETNGAGANGAVVEFPDVAIRRALIEVVKEAQALFGGDITFKSCGGECKEHPHIYVMAMKYGANQVGGFSTFPPNIKNMHPDLQAVSTSPGYIVINQQLSQKEAIGPLDNIQREQQIKFLIWHELLHTLGFAHLMGEKMELPDAATDMTPYQLTATAWTWLLSQPLTIGPLDLMLRNKLDTVPAFHADRDTYDLGEINDWVYGANGKNYYGLPAISIVDSGGENTLLLPKSGQHMVDTNPGYLSTLFSGDVPKRDPKTGSVTKQGREQLMGIVEGVMQKIITRGDSANSIITTAGAAQTYILSAKQSGLLVFDPPGDITVRCEKGANNIMLYAPLVGKLEARQENNDIILDYAGGRIRLQDQLLNKGMNTIVLLNEKGTRLITNPLNTTTTLQQWQDMAETFKSVAEDDKKLRAPKKIGWQQRVEDENVSRDRSY